MSLGVRIERLSVADECPGPGVDVGEYTGGHASENRGSGRGEVRDPRYRERHTEAVAQRPMIWSGGAQGSSYSIATNLALYRERSA